MEGLNTHNPNSPNQWEELVTLLRSEVQEHGALLNLLAEQQKQILSKDCEALLQVNKLIEAQLKTNNELKDQRVDLSEMFFNVFGLDKSASMKDLMPFFPVQVQGLVSALCDELSSITYKAQFRLRQNHLLVQRLMELTQEIFGGVGPSKKTTTYSPQGSVSFRSYASGACIQATA